MSYNYNVEISFNHVLDFEKLTNKIIISWVDINKILLGNNEVLWYDIEINNSIYCKKQTLYTILNAKPKKYYVRVRANFPCGRTLWSQMTSYELFYPAPTLDLSENLLGISPNQYVKQSHLTYIWTDPPAISYNEYILYVNSKQIWIKENIDKNTVKFLTDGIYNTQIRGVNTLFQPPLLSAKSNIIKTMVSFKPSSIIRVDLSFSEVNNFIVTVEDIHLDENDHFEVEMDPFEIIYEKVTRQVGRDTRYIFNINHIGFNYRFKVRVNYDGYLSEWSEYFFKDVQYNRPNISRNIKLIIDNTNKINAYVQDNGHPDGKAIEWIIDGNNKNNVNDISFAEVRYELYRSEYNNNYEKISEMKYNTGGSNYNNIISGENQDITINDNKISMEQKYYYKLRVVYIFFYKHIKYTKVTPFTDFLTLFTCFIENMKFPYGRFNHGIQNEKLYPIISKCFNDDSGKEEIKRSGNIFKRTSYQLTSSELYSLFARTNGMRLR